MANATRRVLTLILGSCLLCQGAHGTEGAAPEITSAVLASDDVAYLTQLSLIRGHAKVGHELFAEGEIQAARSHGRHPRDELYAPLVETFIARGATDFAAQLDGLRQAMEVESSSENLAYRRLTAALGTAEQNLGSRPTDAAKVVQVIINLLREAAEEYGVAFVDGQLVNAHEYQDAYGFTQVALAWANRINDGGDDRIRRVAERIANHIDDLQVMWPTLMPPDRLERRAAQILGAAARVEIAALELP